MKENRTIRIVKCDDFNDYSLRYYPKHLIEDKIINNDSIQEQLNNDCLYIEQFNSETFHNDAITYSSMIDLTRVVGKIKSLFIDNDNYLCAITDNSLIDNISINGIGEVDENNVVKEDTYKFIKFTTH